MSVPHTRTVNAPEHWYHVAHPRVSFALPLGAIVAVGRLVNIIPTVLLREHGLTRQEELFGDYGEGRFGWVFEHVIALPAPVPCKGALGLWTVPPGAAHDVRAGVEATRVTERVMEAR